MKEAIPTFTRINSFPVVTAALSTVAPFLPADEAFMPGSDVFMSPIDPNLLPILLLLTSDSSALLAVVPVLYAGCTNVPTACSILAINSILIRSADVPAKHVFEDTFFVKINGQVTWFWL